MIDDAARWNRVKQVFQDALERPDDEHERFLHSACGDDRELRGEVESLLVAHAAAGSFAQGPAVEALPPPAAVALRDGTWAEHRLHRGARLRHYEILSAIGKGGMGEVWKARDATLLREVAIKLLPEGFVQDPDRLARLEREARLLASLNHPNIATIHGLENDQGTRFLVLELVEGRTLADRLRRGPIPVEESLKLALQIADALEAAHEKGVIHRDLKPANIKVTAEGRVKVLDFGLAKALASASDDVPSLTATPTEVGVIMGTPAYMSPEQARGEAVGRQADVWSFGVVLLELLTGVSPFGRQTTAETLASVLGTQPDYSVLPSDTPANVRHLVRRCLEKDLKRRLRHIGDVRIEIADALSALRIGTAPGPADAVASSQRRWRVAGAMALAVLGGVAGWFLAHRSASTTPASVVRLSIPSLEPPSISPFGSRHLAISPDGSRVAYALGSRLWIRRLGQKEAVSIDVASSSSPFFSPNGEWVGFFDSTGGGLRKVSALGGAPVQIVTTSDRPGGASWRADGTIVFATSEGLYQVSENGGEPRLLVKPDPRRREREYLWPHFMPDGRSVLFTIVPNDSIEGAQIALLDLKTLETRIVLTGGSAARYASTGHLVYASGQAYNDLSVLTLARPDRLEPLLHSSFNEWIGEVSPDGNWIAYESDESGGRMEIFLRPFPNVTGRREKVSIDGGRYPLWGPKDSGELFYVDLKGGMMSAYRYLGHAWFASALARSASKCDAGLTEDQLMSPSLSELLQLPASESAELAMALWESLSEVERDSELEPTLEDVAER